MTPQAFNDIQHLTRYTPDKRSMNSHRGIAPVQWPGDNGLVAVLHMQSHEHARQAV